jgi:hypothetical protein
MTNPPWRQSSRPLVTDVADYGVAISDPVDLSERPAPIVHLRVHTSTERRHVGRVALADNKRGSRKLEGRASYQLPS